MPELPEVETVRRGLEKLIVRRRILDVKVLNPKSFPDIIENLAADETNWMHLLGAKVLAVRRRAKVLIIDLNTNYSLVIHLKMTGQIVFRGDENWGGGHPTDSFLADLPDRSTRVEFYLDDNAKLFFNDQRKFGWIKLVPTPEVEQMDFIKKVGPEPLNAKNAKEMKELEQEYILRIRHRNGTIVKAAILDQTVIAGIGNIYADEALWTAKVHPATRVHNLIDTQLVKVLHGAIAAMNLSLEKGGSTDRNYVDAEGKKGSYLDFAKVFRREGQPCPRCGTIIEKIRVAGRGTHFCPHCQVKVDN
jgi:formamidopyrimidine-DNA glycosylase